jgi:hypothetical protein
MKNLIILIFCLIFLTVNAYAETRKYKEKDCKEIFNAVNIFIYLADKNWKQKDQEGEKKGLFYSEAASNYAQIYSVFCK